MRFSNILLVVTIVTISAFAKIPEPCRDPVIFQNFNTSRYLGHWYQYSRYDHHFEAECDCTTAELDAIDEANIRLTICCQMTRFDNQTQNCEFGVNRITLLKPDTKEAVFKYTRVGSDIEKIAWAVDTDYDNFVIIYGCDSDVRELFWIYTREKVLNETVVKKINELLKFHNFDKDKIIKQRHGADVCQTKRPPRKHHHHH